MSLLSVLRIPIMFGMNKNISLFLYSGILLSNDDFTKKYV